MVCLMVIDFDFPLYGTMMIIVNFVSGLMKLEN